MSAIEKATRGRRVQGEKGPQVSTAEAVVKADPRSELEHQLDATLYGIEILVNLATELRSRLAPVSQPFDSEALTGGYAPLESLPLVPFTERLLEIQSRAARAQDILEDNLRRLAI